MATEKSLLSGIGSMAALTILSKVVRLLILMVTARFLAPEDFGVVAAFSMVLALAYLLSEFGLIKTLIQRPEMNESHIGSALIISFFFSVVTGLLLVFASGEIEILTNVYGIKLPLQISAFLFLLLPISNVFSALFQRNGNVVFIGKVQAFATIFGNVFVTVPLLWFDVGFWAIIIGIFVTEIITLLIICWLGRSFLSFSFAKKEAIEIIKYASAFVSHNVIGLVSKQIDIALVGRNLGNADLGNYSRAMQLIEFPSQIYFLVVDRVVFPAMSAMKSDKERFRMFFIDIYSLLLLILSIGALILYEGANEIIHVVMGQGWQVVVVLLQILSVRVVLKCITTFIDSFLTAYGTVKELTYKNILGLGIYSIAIYLGVDFGLQGVAYAVVIASFINFLMSIFIAIYFANVPFKEVLVGLLPSCSSVLFIVVVYSIISAIVSVPHLISILLAALIWAGLCYLYPTKLFLSLNGSYFLKKFKSERKLKKV